MEPGTSPSRGATVVGPPVAERALWWAGFPVVGAGAGWLLKSVAGWVAALPWVPFQGPFELIASVAGHPWATPAALAVGGIAGVVLAFLAEADCVTVTVGDDDVAVARGDRPQRVRRALVSAVFVDGKQLVLLGHATEELAREGGDLPHIRRLEAAFLARGYPWRSDGDPYRAQFRRWVADTPGLPTGADALLKARARALDKRDRDDAEELRTELGKLGLVVRDEGKRQYWRSTRARGSLP